MANFKGTILVRAKIEFPILLGGFVYITDQPITGITSEVRVKDWGEAVLLMDGSEDSVDLVVSNFPLTSGSTLPGTVRFQDYWDSTYPPEGAKVTIEYSTTDTVAWEVLFVGAIAEVASVTERDVKLAISDLSAKLFRDIGDPITRAEYPQAADDAIDRIKPIALGEIKGYTPPKVRERQRATLKADILASTVITTGTPLLIPVDSNAKWPTTGQLKIDDEHFLFDQTSVVTTTQLRLTGRAQNSTAAAAHTIGKVIRERAQEQWLVAGHNSASIAQVYGVDDNDELVPIDSSLYTAVTTGGLTTITLVGMDGISVSAPAANPTYRRIDLDTAPTLKAPAKLPSSPVPFITNNLPAKNPEFAAGAMAQWSQNNYSSMNFKSRDTLAVKRTASFPYPATPPERSWIGVEYYGLAQFGGETGLVFPIGISDLVVQIANIQDLGKLADTTSTGSQSNPGTCYIRCEKEIMRVLGWTGSAAGESASVLLAVQRGQLGTTASAHSEEAKVSLYALSGAPGSVEEAIYFPQAYLMMEADDGTGNMEVVGKLTDISDVPAEIVEKDKGYTEGTAIEAWHSHPVLGLPIHGKAYNKANFFDAASWELDTQWWDMVVANVVDFTASGAAAKHNELQIALGRDMETPVTLGNVTMVFSVWQNMSISMQQRVKAVRFRVAHSALSATPAGITTTLYLPDGNGNDFIFKQKNFPGNGTFPQNANGLDVAIMTCRFDESTGYPDGIKFKSFLSKHALFRIENLNTNLALVWIVEADFIFDDQQLVKGSDGLEFIGDRTIITRSPSIAYCQAGAYNNTSQYPGPLGATGGWRSTKTIAPWQHNIIAAVPYYDATLNHEVLNDEGQPAFMVRLNADASNTTVRDVQEARLMFTDPTGPGTGRIYKLSLCCFATAKTAAIAPTVTLHNKKLGVSAPPTTFSAGPYSMHDTGTVYSRRVWRFQWDIDASANVDLSQFCADYFIKIVANGSANNGTDAYIESPVLTIETDKDRTLGTIGTNAEQFTRIQYFDISNRVGTYEDVVGKQIELRLPQFGFDFLTNEKTYAADDAYRPILVSRIFYVFRYTGTESKVLDRIAVDFTGIALTAGATGADAITKVLSFGPPLLSANVSTDIDLQSLFDAVVAGMGPLSGVIEERIDARSLLAQMCEQSRVSGYWEGGKYRVTFKYPLAALPASGISFTESLGEIIEDSLEIVRRPKDTINNVLTVRGVPNYAKGGFKSTSSYKAPLSLAKYGQHALEIDGVFIPSTAATDLVAKQQLSYRKEPETIVRFQTTTTTKAKLLTRGQIISVTHSLITSNRLEVYAINKGLGNVDSGVPVFEVECVERPLLTDEAAYP